MARSSVNSPREPYPRPEHSLQQGLISGQPPSAMDSNPFMLKGKIPLAIDPDNLAITLLAALEGGTLLAQVLRGRRPFETAVDTLFALIIGK